MQFDSIFRVISLKNMLEFGSIDPDEIFAHPRNLNVENFAVTIESTAAFFGAETIVVFDLADAID